MKIGRKSGVPGKRASGKDSRACREPESRAPRALPNAHAGDRPNRKPRRKGVKRGFLDGQMLIAMPSMGDERFARAVIYMCAHSADGAMGIIVNQPAAHISFSDLLVQLDVLPAADLIQLPAAGRRREGAQGRSGRHPARLRAPFSADFFIENSTLPIDEGICLTATLDILKAIARGDGPASAVLALGYAGWAPGQLENEIHQNGWLHCPADPELIFGADAEGKYALGAEEDRHRGRHAVERSRARLTVDCQDARALDFPTPAVGALSIRLNGRRSDLIDVAHDLSGRSATFGLMRYRANSSRSDASSVLASSALIGSPKM